MRLTITRAVSGWSGRTNHWARANRRPVFCARPRRLHDERRPAVCEHGRHARADGPHRLLGIALPIDVRWRRIAPIPEGKDGRPEEQLVLKRFHLAGGLASAAFLNSASSSTSCVTSNRNAFSNLSARYFCTASRFSGGVASIRRKSARRTSGSFARASSRNFCRRGSAPRSKSFRSAASCAPSGALWACSLRVSSAVRCGKTRS